MSSVMHPPRWRKPCAVLVFLAAVAGCGSSDSTSEGDVELLRQPVSGTAPVAAKSGHLGAPAGCLILTEDDGSPHSLIFEDSLDIRIRNDQLILAGNSKGVIGKTGVRVSLLGRDGPVSYYDAVSVVTGPIDVQCNQTDPWVVTQISVI